MTDPFDRGTVYIEEKIRYCKRLACFFSRQVGNRLSTKRVVTPWNLLVRGSRKLARDRVFPRLQTRSTTNRPVRGADYWHNGSAQIPANYLAEPFATSIIIPSAIVSRTRVGTDRDCAWRHTGCEGTIGVKRWPEVRGSTTFGPLSSRNSDGSVLKTSFVFWISPKITKISDNIAERMLILYI